MSRKLNSHYKLKEYENCNVNIYNVICQTVYFKREREKERENLVINECWDIYRFTQISPKFSIEKYYH